MSIFHPSQALPNCHNCHLEPHLPRVHPAQTCCVQLMTRWFIAGLSRLSHGPQKRLRFEPSNLRENHGKSMVNHMANPTVNAHEFLANPSSDIHQLGLIWDLYHPISSPWILGKSDHSQTTLCTENNDGIITRIHGDQWPRCVSWSRGQNCWPNRTVPQHGGIASLAECFEQNGQVSGDIFNVSRKIWK